MCMSVLVTVRIPKKLKEEAKKYGINISRLLREALIKEITKKKLERINELQKNAKKILSKINKRDLIEVIREIRNEY